MVLDYDNSAIKWGDTEAYVKSDDDYYSQEKLCAAFVDSTDPKEVIKENNRTNKKLDVIYEKADMKN